MSSSWYDLLLSIYNATINMYKIIPPIHIAFGTFGNVFNMIIFTRPNLRNNPCSIYFLASSINNLFFIYLLTALRYISFMLDLNFTQSSNLLCKISILVQYVPFSLVIWFPVLASIDRFLSSSRTVRLRQLSSVSVARRVIIGIYIVFLLIHVHMPIFYESAWDNDAFGCGISSYQYFLFFTFFGPIVACLLPILLMCIFAISIVHNVRSTRNRVFQQTGVARNERLRSEDRQMATMLLFQILVTILLSLPYVSTSLYYAFDLVILDNTLSLLGQIIFRCAQALAMFLFYTNSITGFYIYTLTSPKFRAEMQRCVNEIGFG
ncbi:unnamed protein product [Adineta ricciae]|uniref:G-protein coupled receptors family 1 profile domain-containing protein n=1 Tax=Adineta ricciae TaxID=249248 RepID=A0A815A2R6_ADIRI|nr:unnamed protein product [Adineta ricciae]